MSDATRLERASHVVSGERSELRLAEAEIRIVKEPVGEAPSTVTVPVGRIRGATLQKPSRGQPGWLHVSAVGGSPVPTTDLGATLDPYTVPVTNRTLPAARRLVRLIEHHVRERGLPPESPHARAGPSTSVIVSPTTGARAAPVPDHDPVVDPDVTGRHTAEGRRLIDSLRELAELHAAGALSDEEFQKAKARVLGDEA